MPLEIRCDGSREESGSLKQIESVLSLDVGVRCAIAGVGFLLHCLAGPVSIGDHELFQHK